MVETDNFELMSDSSAREGACSKRAFALHRFRAAPGLGFLLYGGKVNRNLPIETAKYWFGSTLGGPAASHYFA